MSTDQQAADKLIDAGNYDEDRGDLVEAQMKYVAATELAANYARAWINLGIVRVALQRYDTAVVAFDRALMLEPANAAALFNRGLAFAALGRFDDAEQGYRASLVHRPNLLDAYAALADVQEARGDRGAAEQTLMQLVNQAPTHSGYLKNLGILQRQIGKLDAAEATFRSAMIADPSDPIFSVALAGVLREKADHRGAFRVLEHARSRYSWNPSVESELLFTSLYRDDLSAGQVADLHRRSGSGFESKPTLVELSQRAVEVRRGRLRVGYVSGDFRRHAIANFALPVIEGHDRSNVEVFCYSNVHSADDVTARFCRTADAWRDIRRLDDGAVAAQIRSDEIDILVDLSGHSGGNRLGVFALKPAPVQVSWLGYLNTTGLTRIDYRICDHYTDSIERTQAFHSESLQFMPASQWCYRPYLEPTLRAEPPHAASRFVTFGSFNQFAKISPTTIALWVEILRELDDSRLLVLGAPIGEVRARFVKQFWSQGIAQERIEVIDRIDLAQYYAVLGRADVALDTTPYSGATTTCDALWMGVPVVSLAGDRSVSRSGASILTTVGLEQFVAQTPETYITSAIALANDVDQIRTLRHELRGRMRASPLMDEPRFVCDLEILYDAIWRRYCECSHDSF